MGTYHFYQVFADGIFGFWSIYSNNNNTWKKEYITPMINNGIWVRRSIWNYVRGS